MNRLKGEGKDCLVKKKKPCKQNTFQDIFFFRKASVVSSETLAVTADKQQWPGFPHCPVAAQVRRVQTLSTQEELVEEPSPRDKRIS